MRIGDRVRIDVPEAVRLKFGHPTMWWGVVRAFDKAKGTYAVDVADYDAADTKFGGVFRSCGSYEMLPENIYPAGWGEPLKHKTGERVQFTDTPYNRDDDVVGKAGVILDTDESRGQVHILLDDLRRGREQKTWAFASEVESEAEAQANLAAMNSDTTDSEANPKTIRDASILASLESGGLIRTPEGVDPRSGLTGPEKAAMDALVHFWNLYVQLPVHHPTEQTEACYHVNALQNVIGVRVARSVFPDMWPTHPTHEETLQEMKTHLGNILREPG